MLRNAPLAKKLSRISNLASGMALLAAVVAISLYETYALYDTTDSALKRAADKLTPTLERAILLQWQNMPDAIFDGIRDREKVAAACLYAPDGRILAQHFPDYTGYVGNEFTFPPLQRDGLQWVDGHVGLFRTVSPEEGHTGVLFLELNTAFVLAPFLNRLLFLCVTALSCLFLSNVVATRTRDVIARPIITLADAAGRALRDKNYDVTMGAYGGNDEIGTLITHMTALVSQLETQELALQETNATIEDKVRQRTRELESEVDEGKKAKVALAESQRKLATLLSNLPGMAYRSYGDKHWEMAFVSDGAYQLTGFRPSELAHNKQVAFSKLVHPEDKAKVSIEIATAIKKNQHFQNIYRLRTKSGQTKWVWEKGRGVYSYEKGLVAIEGLITDISDRIRAEQKLQLYAVKLKKSNRELEDFAHVASHDLQEPLRKVRTFGDRLMSKYGDRLGVNGRDYIARMQNASARMQTLISDLLAYSRVTTKTQPFTRINLEALVKEVLSDLEVRIEEVRARIEIGNLPVLWADPLQMRQLFQNLIGNALKFHVKNRPPLVKIYGLQSAPPGPSKQMSDRAKPPRVHIVVEDNGIGFDDKQAERIFGVFQRLHGKQEYEGTGVGLAVCKKIAETHGGSIVAQGCPGKGAKFTVSLATPQRTVQQEQPRVDDSEMNETSERRLANG